MHLLAFIDVIACNLSHSLSIIFLCISLVNIVQCITKYLVVNCMWYIINAVITFSSCFGVGLWGMSRHFSTDPFMRETTIVF